MKKILIIEDDRVITQIYRGRYQSSGFDVEAAATGEAGLQMLKDFQPDIVQLDLGLPGMSGVNVIRAIRQQSQYAKLPIIVLSRCYLPEQVREAWKAGANRCIAKQNCTPNNVLEIINQLLAPGAAGAMPSAPAAPPEETTHVPRSSPPRDNGASPAEFAVTQAGVRDEFVRRFPQMHADLRNRLHAFVKALQPAEQLGFLKELHKSVHFLSGYAGIAGLSRICQMSDALEMLLNDLQSKPKQINPSTLRTIAIAVDTLGAMFTQTDQPHDDALQSLLILAVDDEPISRQVICSALAKAHLKAVGLSDARLALKVLEENSFDIVFLDVEMPDIDGFELCRQLRALPNNKNASVVFVTSLSDFESRAHSTLSGGNDLIAKPFLLMELAVKALTIAFKTKPA